MKNHIVFLFFICFIYKTYGQEKTTAFKDGEWLKYKVSYSGFLRAGSIVLEVKETNYKDKKVFHSKGTGWTTGLVKLFFEVDDNYESYFNKENIKPYLFKRKVREGNYRKNVIMSFNHKYKKAYIQDFNLQKDTSIVFHNIQDMLSSFYYLRRKEVEKMKINQEVEINILLDSQIYPFKVRFLGREVLKTRFGKVKTLLFKPIIHSKRVFKDEESVIVWITEDANKIPIKLKANLAVGSLRADLEKYRNLANKFVKQ